MVINEGVHITDNSKCVYLTQIIRKAASHWDMLVQTNGCISYIRPVGKDKV